MLNTSITCLLGAMLLGLMEMVGTATGLANLLFFAFLVTFLASLVLIPKHTPK